jgi:hypothetical protein
VLGKAKRVSGVDRDYLIHPIAEDESTVHDADFGVWQQGEFAVQITRQGRQVVHGQIIAGRDGVVKSR